MIDYVKIRFLDKECIDKYIRDGRRNASIKTDRKDSNKRTYTIFLENLTIKSSPSETILEGSLHSYFNAIKGRTTGRENPKWINYNNFTLSNLNETIEHLGKKLNYDMEKTKVVTCEFGFNLNINESPSDFLDNHVLMYKYKSPCYDPKYKNNMKIKKFELTNYTVKIYDKSLQYGLSNKNIIRYEIVFRSKELYDPNIVSAIDLIDADKLGYLYEKLIKRYDEILVIDSYDGTSSSVPKKIRKLLVDLTNPQYWIQSRKSDDQCKYYRIKNDKVELDKLMIRYKLDTKKNYLKNLINMEFNYLVIN